MSNQHQLSPQSNRAVNVLKVSSLALLLIALTGVVSSASAAAKDPHKAEKSSFASAPT